MSENRVQLDQDGKVLHNGKLSLNNCQEPVDISILLDEAKRSSKAEVRDNVDGEKLDAFSNIEGSCCVLIGEVIGFDATYPIHETIVDGSFEAFDILTSVLDLFSKGWSSSGIHTPMLIFCRRMVCFRSSRSDTIFVA